MTDDQLLGTLNIEIPLGDLDDEPRQQLIDVAAEDREVLAQRLEVEDVAKLVADLEATRHGDLIRVAGSFEADLGRICVVSLDPMRELVNEHFAVEYTTVAEDVSEEEMEANLDAPEPLTGDVLDFGAVLTEQLVLAMDPHPRREGAVPPADPKAGQETGPFDVLKQLKGDG